MFPRETPWLSDNIMWCVVLGRHLVGSQKSFEHSVSTFLPAMVWRERPADSS